MLIWNADASGQLGRQNQEEQHSHIIGPFAYGKETEKKEMGKDYTILAKHTI